VSTHNLKRNKLLQGPYGLKFKDLPLPQPDNIMVNSPGIDGIRFGDAGNEYMIPFENNAKGKYLERKSIDISKDRQNLNIILAVGRLHFDKNFHTLAQAFKENKKLNEKANLVLVVNGPVEDQNENYILNMQKALKAGVNKLKGFSGSSLEQLINLAKILDSDELKGKWTAVSLPDGRDYAGIQRYLGKQGSTVSGLFSLKEPYGLSPWESIYCGVPVVVSKNSGVAEELIEAGAYSFNPHNSHEIADALLKTFDHFDEVKKSQVSASKKKDWCETAKRMMVNINKKKRVMMSSSKIGPIHVEDESFIADGMELVLKALKKEYKRGQNGEFKELFDSIKQKVETL